MTKENNTFLLEVVTPSRQYFTGQVRSLILSTADGQLGVERGHESAVTAIVPGELSFQNGDGWQIAVVGEGFAEIDRDRVVVLVHFAERPEEIDRVRAEEELLRAQEELRQKRSIQEYYRSKMAMARAMARLKAGQHSGM